MQLLAGVLDALDYTLSTMAALDLATAPIRQLHAYSSV